MAKIPKKKSDRARQLAVLRGLEADCQQIRQLLALPPLIVPHYESELDRTLHNTDSECPFCHGSNIDVSEYDSGKEMTQKVTCSDCDEEWWEMYRFVGAWQDKDEK